MRGRLTDETPSFPYPGETVFSDTERNKKAQEFLVVLSLLVCFVCHDFRESCTTCFCSAI